MQAFQQKPSLSRALHSPWVIQSNNSHKWQHAMDSTPYSSAGAPTLFGFGVRLLQLCANLSCSAATLNNRLRKCQLKIFDKIPNKKLPPRRPWVEFNGVFWSVSSMFAMGLHADTDTCNQQIVYVQQELPTLSTDRLDVGLVWLATLGMHIIPSQECRALTTGSELLVLPWNIADLPTGMITTR